MFTCSRSLSRFDRLFRAVWAPIPLSDPLFRTKNCFHDQSLSSNWKMASAKDVPLKMDHRKRQKAVTRIYRPISTQSVTNEVFNDDSQLPEAQRDAISSASNCQNFTEDEPVKDISLKSTSSASAVEYDKQPEAAVKEQSVSSICELQNVSESGDSVSASKSEEAPVQEIEKCTAQEIGINNDVELGRGEERCSVSVEVGTTGIRLLRGRGGLKKKLIEETTGVKLIFPSSREEDSVVIEGNTVESVAKASANISSILEEAAKSPMLDYSHFISLPLAIHPELVEKLNCFQNSVLGDTCCLGDNLDNGSNEEEASEDEDSLSESHKVAVKLEAQDEKEHVKAKIDTTDTKSDTEASVSADLGIDRSIFINPKTFHLTVLMLKLWNKERVAAAREVLQRILSKVHDALENRPVSIRLRGLMCMRGSPAKAQVVYAPVKEIGGEGRLLRACQIIIDAYIEAGLVLEKDAQQTLKLHATLMNARHRKRSKRTRRDDSFDARHIFRVYGSRDWGEYLIREVHLSQRFKYDEKGYYHCCASIPLPENMQVG